jgi:hypothetical protein
MLPIREGYYEDEDVHVAIRAEGLFPKRTGSSISSTIVARSKPWFFRIAQNRSIDFLRRRGVRDEAETMAAVPEATKATEPVALGMFELSVPISRAWLKPRRGTAIMEY